MTDQPAQYKPRHEALDENGTPAVRDWRTAIYPYTGKHRTPTPGGAQ